MDLMTAVRQYGPDLGRYVASSNGPDVVAHELQADGSRRSLEVLARVFAHVRALEVADFLSGEPLAETEAAAAPHLEAIAEAEQRLEEAGEAHARAMVSFWQRVGAKGTAPGEPHELTHAREAVTEARQAARMPLYELKMLQDKIEYLRTKTAPAPADLAALAAALKVEVCSCER